VPVSKNREACYWFTVLVIKLRKKRKIKLPDAIIAATALCSDLNLLSLDRHLLSFMNAARKEH